MIVHWLDAALLEASPYPLLLFTFDGHLITCNRAARQVFGKTIWLQSDIFGLGKRERLGLNLEDLPAMGGSFRIERSERRSAYESMIDALALPNSSYEVDLPIKKKNEQGVETTWYCRVLAQRHVDPVIRRSHHKGLASRRHGPPQGRRRVGAHPDERSHEQGADDARFRRCRLVADALGSRLGLPPDAR